MAEHIASPFMGGRFKSEKIRIYSIFFFLVILEILIFSFLVNFNQ